MHIFEDRYRVLVADSLRDEREFGIIYVEGDTLRPVGCTASIREVTRRYEDGRMDIVVAGHRRFELERIADPKTPYIVGEVRFLEQPPEEQDPEMRGRAVALYNELVERVFKNEVEPVDPERAGPELSFKLAQKAGMDLSERQRLLETPLERDRLQAVIEHLERVIPLLDRIDSLDGIVRNDGYI